MATKTRSINCTLLQCNHTHLLSIRSFYCTTCLNFNTLLYFIVLYMYVLLLVDIFPILYYTILHCTVLYCTCTLPHHFPQIVHCFIHRFRLYLDCTKLYTPELFLVKPLLIVYSLLYCTVHTCTASRRPVPSSSWPAVAASHSPASGSST